MSQAFIPRLFEGFAALDRLTSRVRFAGVIGGAGPPVLLLHGYPQCHATWHDVAPTLAKRYTVIAPDLPGYGKSRVLDAGLAQASSRHGTRRNDARARARSLCRYRA
jgi:haloacetate dehalogenase